MPKKRASHLVPGLELHHGKFRWRRMVKGRRVTVNLDTADRSEAIRLALDLEGKPSLSAGDGWEAEARRFVEASIAARKLSPQYGKSRLDVLLKAGRDMGLMEVRELTRARAVVWYEGLLAGDAVSEGTAGHYLAHLKQFAKWLVKGGKLLANPVAAVTAAHVDEVLRDVFVSSDVVSLLLADARRLGDADLELLLLLGFECGMRMGEISAARSAWVDVERGLITIPAVDKQAPEREWGRKGKTGRRRAVTVPMSAEVRGWFGRHGVPEPFLLRPGKGWGKHVYRYDFRKKLGNFFKVHKVVCNPHDMRRSFGSNRVSAGVSIEKVANWMGIAPGTAWKHYARFIPGDAEIDRGGASVVPVAVENVERGAGGDKDDEAAMRVELALVARLLADGLIDEEDARARRAEILRG